MDDEDETWESSEPSELVGDEERIEVEAELLSFDCCG
jgi:hypothetical protein